MVVKGNQNDKNCLNPLTLKTIEIPLTPKTPEIIKAKEYSLFFMTRDLG